MKNRTQKLVKRWLAMLLCMCMIVPSAVTRVSAAEEPAYTGGLCEHHTEHTEDCGYVEAVEDQPCTHVHDGNCGYQEPTEEISCAHVHDDSCGYQAAVAENPCDKGCTDEDGDGNIDHQEGCAYQPAVEEQPCTHTHDANCGYQAATEGSPCTHVHDGSCGYVEAVEGQPCTFVCEICSGEQEEQVLLSEDNIQITLDTPVGYVNQEYNLLDKATVTPEQDEKGNPIKLRITELKANPEDTEYEWNNPVLKVTSNENVAFTVTYEAYVELEEAQEGQETEKVLATKQFTFPVYASGEIGDRLDGDFAYISDAYLTADEDTDSKMAIRTGTAPWDDDNTDGNDSGPLNNTVRSFDVVTYTAAFKTQVRPSGPYTAYKTGTVYYEFVVEGTKDLVRFETESMGWMTAKAEGKFDVTEETHDGKTYQVLRGSFLAEPADGNPSAIGNSYQELNIALRVLAMTQGDTVKPQFTFWLEGNDVPEEGLVTGSGHPCAEHRGEEYKTITAPDVSVTSAPRYNLKIENGNEATNQALGSFDFSTGNELAQNKDAGEVNGRIHGFGVTIQIVGKSPQHGLRGCELPDGSPITFNLSLSSEFLGNDGNETADDGYSPLLWSLDGNGNIQQSDGRSLDMVQGKAVMGTPTNVIENGIDHYGCANGGTWTGTQEESTIHVTVSDYAVDLTKLPYAYYGGGETSYIYYNPNNISGYWEVQYASFSAGEIWVVQPFYDEEDNYIVDKYGSGSFNLTIDDQNLKMTGESGVELDKVIDNSNQAVQTDDRKTQTSYLAKEGRLSVGISYRKANNINLSLTEGCYSNGKDWTLLGNSLGMQGALNHNQAEGVNAGVAYDYLMKFDDAFFAIERITGNVGDKLLYGAKPDKTGWNHQDKRPDESGYDDEMLQATADDLIFFTSLEELKQEGYICVAVLHEVRGVKNAASVGFSTNVFGHMKSDVQLVDHVFMITHSAKAWNKADVQAAVAAYVNKEISALTDEDYNAYVKSEAFPSRADKDMQLSYEKDYLASFWTFDYNSTDGLKNYIKSQYDENGYVTGISGTGYGDSCLVVDYSTQITKSPNQPGTDESGKKLTYDMDTGQREVDYVLYPTAIRSQGESTTEGASTTTTVYIEDTLPAGLEYILNSAYYGGEYTSNGGGRAGTVTGGKQLQPTITENADGTTTLLFTLEDVTITAEEITRLEPIYYSCLIGTPDNEETDVVNQQQLVNSVKIWSADEQIRDFVATNGNYAEQSILISKNKGVSFSKTSDQKIVDVGDEMGFTIHHGNNSSNSMDVVDIDFLPHNEDGRGTQITGQVIVSELTIQSKDLIKGFKLYYTTDTAKRNTTAAYYKASDFTKANGWTEMEVDADTGAVKLPDTTHVIVAVAAVGTLPPNSTLKMHISFEVPDGKPGEFLVNSFGSGDMESNARTYIVNRLLEGVVWLDADQDGLRDSDETLLDGVKVTLMQKGKDGNYTPYLLDEKPISVETGKQINVLTGETSDNTRGTGAYGFHHLPQGDFAVKFEDGQNVNLGDYTATQANVGTNDTIDSDAIAHEQDGDLVSASIEGIEMPEAKKITVQTYESHYHDLGLYASQINIPVEKVWNDNNDQDGKRPDFVTVTLYVDDKSTGQSLTLNEANGWKGAFENLVESENGKKINYTVKEAPVSGYASATTGSASEGFTITNSYTPETVDVSGSKTWNDNNNQDGKRPESITVSLLADGSKAAEKEVTAADNWTWTFENLPKYKDGKLIDYTIQEEDVPGYTPSYSGYNVTNSYTPGKVAIPVIKSWQDNNDQDGLRPQSVTVKLLADGRDTGKTLILSEGNGWSGIFTNLDEYAVGKKIAYTIEEISVDGYDTTITGDASDGFTIINTHNPETITLSGTKTWNDADNQDGKRPGSITIRLYADGAEVAHKEVTAEEGWKWSFADMPKYADGKEITYTISEDAVEGYTPTYTDFNVTNTYTPEQTSVTVTKAWADNDNQDGKRPESITVKLLADGQETKETLTLSSGNNWTGTFNGLDKYKDGKKIAYTIEEVEVNGYSTVVTGDASTGFVITNSHTPETISISGSKIWDDADDQDGKRPESITVNLLADGSKMSEKEVTASDNWTWTFENLPKYKEGKLVNYSIQEEAVPGYTPSYSGYDITNRYAPGKVAISATKSWQDNNDQDGLRPQFVTVKLLADGKDTRKTLILSEGNGWSGTFTDLDEYAAGEKIVYTIEEISVDGYDTTITGDVSKGFTITNTHNPKTITLSGAKTWNDADNQDGKRPGSITIRLYADGAEVAHKEVTAEEGWKWSFADMPKYEEGKEITYTISEDTVDGYTPTYNDLNVTNTYTPEQTSVTVTKAWDDKNDQDGIRPESITVKLLAEGQETKETLILSSGNNWTGTFNGLDKYKDGKEITYTIEEVSVNGYSTVVTGDASTGFVITNSHTPDTISISGSKTWDDADDQDGKRPESITVNLLADGSKMSEKEVTASDNWTWTFENLPKYKEGKLVNYSIQEEAVPGYTPSYSGYDITNRYAPGKVAISATKSWQDNNDQDGLRPQSVTVKLLADGKDTGKTLILSEGNGWSGTFTDLDEYAAGEKIVYTIEEISVDGYDTTITGDVSKGFTITNTHNPKTITLSGAKTWNDADNQDGKRPGSITIRLYADGAEVAHKEVTAEEGWKWSFADMPKYEEGKEITYTISEDAVEGYTPTYTDFNVTNTYTPEQTSVTVTKAWDDKNDQDGIRPESITVKLLADGQETKETLTLSNRNNWTGIFTGLDKYKDGKEITYTIEEVSVNGYSTVVTGDASTGFVITNSHTPETIDISGSKTWDDKENQDGKRPESITIRLYADGKELRRLEVNEEDNWKWLFEDLPKYENGREIVYTITEDAVTDYTAIINGYDVTNSYTPDLQKDPQDYHYPVQPGTPGDGQTTPKTGDTSSFAGWIVLLSLSGIGLAVTSFNIVRKKHKR